ncbi:MAG TPA: VOC family protein [Devosia sp.]|nr:VOC family protein [Devosia sp.]
MSSRLNPYLSFKGNAREAMNFYKSVFGGELSLFTFGEGGAAPDPSANDLVMHGQLETPDGYTLMGSDTPPGMDFQRAGGMTVSIFGDDEAKLRGHWDKLAAGATVMMPLEKASWGDTFGMLTDKYGTPWMVNISAPGQN